MFAHFIIAQKAVTKRANTQMGKLHIWSKLNTKQKCRQGFLHQITKCCPKLTWKWTQEMWRVMGFALSSWKKLEFSRIGRRVWRRRRRRRRRCGGSWKKGRKEWFIDREVVLMMLKVVFESAGQWLWSWRWLGLWIVGKGGGNGEEEYFVNILPYVFVMVITIRDCHNVPEGRCDRRQNSMESPIIFIYLRKKN